MTYFLGVDLGTTYTAAAVLRNGMADMVEMGSRSAVIPSVVFLREDEEILTGDAANRRGSTEPGRVAREFKRRFGDTTPILLGGSPYSADTLTSKLLRWVADHVAKVEGGAPTKIAVAHPANWGPYKRDLLEQAIRSADLNNAIMITEPVAAVTHYATLERVAPGSIIAVYDLGGGTFDAAVVRTTESGNYELLGDPEGIERLGGIDFDEAVFAHVRGAIGNALDALDPNDPGAVSAVARLRAECVEAKEALSSDTEVSIPVLLPNLTTDVRLTRAEFESMVRPPLQGSIASMQRAVRNAGLQPGQVDAVLLVGGSSRIPLVGQLVAAELGRPVAVDAHPKHAIALGAARAAERAANPGARVGTPVVADQGRTPDNAAAAPPRPSAVPDLPASMAPATIAFTPPVPPPDRNEPAPPVRPAPTPAAPNVAPAAPVAAPSSAEPPRVPPAPTSGSDAPTVISAPMTPMPQTYPSAPIAQHRAPPASESRPPAPVQPRPPQPASPPSEPTQRIPLTQGPTPAPLPAGGPPQPPPSGTPMPTPAPTSSGGGKSKLPLILGGVAALVAAMVVGFVLTRGGGDDVATGDGTNTGETTLPGQTTVVPVETTAAGTGTTAATVEATVAPPVTVPDPCDTIADGVPCLRILGYTPDPFSLAWEAVYYVPRLNDRHAHFFWDIYTPNQVGTGLTGVADGTGAWDLTADIPFNGGGTVGAGNMPPGATAICGTPSNSSHDVIDPTVYDCIDVTTGERVDPFGLK